MRAEIPGSKIWCRLLVPWFIMAEKPAKHKLLQLSSKKLANRLKEQLILPNKI